MLLTLIPVRSVVSKELLGQFNTPAFSPARVGDILFLFFFSSAEHWNSVLRATRDPFTHKVLEYVNSVRDLAFLLKFQCLHSPTPNSSYPSQFQ